MANAFINSLIVTIPCDRHPHHRGGLRGLRVRVDAVPAPAARCSWSSSGCWSCRSRCRSSRCSSCTSTLGINNTFLGVWLAHTAFGLPLAIFLLYNFISQLPGDLFETASIDGATHFQMFPKIVLPLSVPALAAFAIFQFLWVWNDLLVALVFLSAETEQSVLTLELSRAGRRARRAVAPADGRRVRDDARCRCSCSWRSSGTSCGASCRGPSRDDRRARRRVAVRRPAEARWAG